MLARLKHFSGKGLAELAALAPDAAAVAAARKSGGSGGGSSDGDAEHALVTSPAAAIVLRSAVQLVEAALAVPPALDVIALELGAAPTKAAGKAKVTRKDAHAGDATAVPTVVVCDAQFWVGDDLAHAWKGLSLATKRLLTAATAAAADAAAAAGDASSLSAESERASAGASAAAVASASGAAGLARDALALAAWWEGTLVRVERWQRKSLAGRKRLHDLRRLRREPPLKLGPGGGGGGGRSGSGGLEAWLTVAEVRAARDALAALASWPESDAVTNAVTSAVTNAGSDGGGAAAGGREEEDEGDDDEEEEGEEEEEEEDDDDDEENEEEDD